MVKTIYFVHECDQPLTIVFDYDAYDYTFKDFGFPVIKCPKCGRHVWARMRCDPEYIDTVLE